MDGIVAVVEYIESKLFRFEDDNNPVKAEFSIFYPPFNVPYLNMFFTCNAAIFAEMLANLDIGCDKCTNESSLHVLARQETGTHVIKLFTSMLVGVMCDDKLVTSIDPCDCLNRVLPVLVHNNLLDGALLYWIYFSLFYALGLMANTGITGRPSRADKENEGEEVDESPKIVLSAILSRTASLFARLAPLVSRQVAKTCLGYALSLKKMRYPRVTPKIEKRREEFARLLESKVTRVERVAMVELLSNPSPDGEAIQETLKSFTKKFIEKPTS